MLLLLGALLLVLALLQFLPISVDDAVASDPASNYEEALARVEAVQAQEGASGIVNPVCESILLSHGERTEEAIIFYHGFTSCPEQYRELGQQFFADGYNVFIPRLPHHGRANRDRDALLATSAEELAAFTAQTVDIGRGLGRNVIVSGLSGGGTLAAYVAQHNEDVEEVVIVAPFLGIGFIPAPLNRIVARVIDNIPNIDMWWDPERKENNPNTAAYAYPGYPLHALAEYLRLGFATQDAARSAKPAADSIYVISNAHDRSVNNAVTNRLVSAWQAHGEEALRTYEFPAELRLPHDLITPTREDGNPALVYPVIVDSIRIE